MAGLLRNYTLRLIGPVVLGGLLGLNINCSGTEQKKGTKAPARQEIILAEPVVTYPRSEGKTRITQVHDTPNHYYNIHDYDGDGRAENIEEIMTVMEPRRLAEGIIGLRKLSYQEMDDYTTIIKRRGTLDGLFEELDSDSSVELLLKKYDYGNKDYEDTKAHLGELTGSSIENLLIRN